MVTSGDPATWAANRKAALQKLREKKKLRNFQKKVRRLYAAHKTSVLSYP